MRIETYLNALEQVSTELDHLLSLYKFDKGLIPRRSRQRKAFRKRIMRMFEALEGVIKLQNDALAQRRQRIAELELAIEYLEPNHRLLDGVE